MKTRDEYLEEAKIELGEREFKRMCASLDNGYYRSVASQVNKGIPIPRAVYESLSEGQIYHFDRFMNPNGDMVLD